MDIEEIKEKFNQACIGYDYTAMWKIIEVLMPEVDRLQKAMSIIEQYGSIDGGHHKQWVIDQVVRSLVNDYEGWVASMKYGEDGPDTYEWDQGVAP